MNRCKNCQTFIRKGEKICNRCKEKYENMTIIANMMNEIEIKKQDIRLLKYFSVLMVILTITLIIVYNIKLIEKFF